MAPLGFLVVRTYHQSQLAYSILSSVMTTRSGTIHMSPPAALKKEKAKAKAEEDDSDDSDGSDDSDESDDWEYESSEDED